MIQPDKHVQDLFDIVGKTVDNVEYGPSDGRHPDYAIIIFTDGTALTIKTSEWFEEIILGSHLQIGWGDKREKSS